MTSYTVQLATRLELAGLSTEDFQHATQIRYLLEVATLPLPLF